MTGKPEPRPGYAPSTIAHCLSAVSGFYAFHMHFGRGPLVNPVPESSSRRKALAHRSPLMEAPQYRRARLRPKIAPRVIRSLPDGLFDDLFASMHCDRDRALLAFYVSSGARASELPGLLIEDVDWAGKKIYVISKGSRSRQPVPASADAFVYLAAYLDKAGVPPTGTPVWRTVRGTPRPLTYWAMRQVLERANEHLGTNWTLHDLRHTAAARLAADPGITLVEVQAIMRHAHLTTTQLYTPPRLDDLMDKLAVPPVHIPYGGAALPAYDLTPDGPTRGTIVATGGFDEYVEESFPLLAAACRAGYRVIAFDGPGQGGALEDARLPLTPAWEEPVGAVLDHFEVSDVTLIGISLGGGLAIRAAAFEPRVRRVVAVDVLDDFLECLARQAIPGAAPALRALLAARARPLVNLAARLTAARKPVADWGLRQGMHVTATPTPYGFFQAARALTTRSVSARVTADVLLLAGASDHYVPLHQLHRQAAALTRARSVTTRTFTAAEQTHNHCQIGNLGAALRAVLTWLDSLAPEHQPTSATSGR